MKIQALYPGEIIHLGVTTLHTKQDGDVYYAFAVDNHSDYVFNLGIHKALTQKEVVLIINELLSHPDLERKLPIKIVTNMVTALPPEIANQFSDRCSFIPLEKPNDRKIEKYLEYFTARLVEGDRSQ